MLKARGEKEASDEWYQKAQDLKEYFNNDWSVKGGDSNGSYSCALGKDGTTKYNDFRKETSWFMPMKELTEAGERTDAFLDFIKENVGDGIGDKANSPVNIEAWSYLPDVFFPYNRADDAWKYMQYILSVKDKPHEIAVQGTNGDYPEISFTFVSQTITGMMGVTPDADAHKVSTVSRLPKDVGYVKANGIRVGEHTLDVEHDGLTNTTVTNHSDKILEWTAQFYGDYDYIQAGNQVLAAKKKEINGEMVSYATIEVASGESVNAKITEEKPEILPYKDVEKSDWFYDYVYVKKQLDIIKPDIFWEVNTIIPINLGGSFKTMITIHDMFPIEYVEYFGQVYSMYFKYNLKKTLKNTDMILYNSEQTKRSTPFLFSILPT